MMRTVRRDNCPLCGASSVPFRTGLQDRIFGTPGEWRLSACCDEDCGLVWLNPTPLESEMSKAYEQYYTHQPQTAATDSGGTSTFRTLQHWYARLLGCAAERARLEIFCLDGDRPGRVLDVGCGNGARLQRLAAAGWQAEGQEVDPEAAGAAKALGLDVHVGPLDDAHFSERRYDAIVSNHVVEHLHDPGAMARRCRGLLEDNGKLVIITPNVRSLGSRLFGNDWRGLEPPRHIQIFSPAALRKLLRDSGYSDVSVFTSSARADLIMTGSIDLKFRGKHAPSHARPSVANALLTVVLWTVARLGTIFSRHSGEEVVAIARR